MHRISKNMVVVICLFSFGCQQRVTHSLVVLHYSGKGFRSHTLHTSSEQRCLPGVWIMVCAVRSTASTKGEQPHCQVRRRSELFFFRDDATTRDKSNFGGWFSSWRRISRKVTCLFGPQRKEAHHWTRSLPHLCKCK